VASLRDIFVRLGVQTDPKGFQKANQGLEGLKNTASKLTQFLVTGAVAVGFKKMIEVASDIEETANKFGAVFGAAGGGVQQQLDDISERTGATNLQLQDMASNIGALVKPSLGSAEAAGELAAGISELALDISSFNNVEADDALRSLRSGLIGSAEPLQRFGVDVRKQALAQEAFRQGITKSIKEMTEGERIQLRYAAIQRQLGAQGATGDATRTAEGFANASRNLASAIKETAGIIGTFFLKRVGGAVLVMRRAVNAVQDWLFENRKLIQQGLDVFFDKAGRVIGAVADLIQEGVQAARDWADSLGPVGQQILKVTGIVMALVAVLMLPGVPILLLIALIALLIEDFQTWRAGGESVIGDIIGWFEELTGSVEEYIDAVGDSIDGMVEWAKEHKTGIAIVTSLLIGLAAVILGKVVVANWAAISSFLFWKTLNIVGSAAIAAANVASAVASAAAWVAGAAASAAAWLAATLPLVLTAVLLGVIVGLFIWLGYELYKLATGSENFFTTMWQGIKGLIEEWGGVSGAIWAMLQEALKFWLDFFGVNEKKVDEWIENLTDTLMTFWDNIIEHWSRVLGGWWDAWKDKIDFGLGGDDEEETDRRAAELYRRSEARRAQREASAAEEAAITQGAMQGVVGPGGVQLPVQTAAAAAAAGAAGAGGAGVVNNETTQNFNVQVNAEPGMDEERLAEAFSGEVRRAAQSFVVEAPNGAS